MQVPSSDIKCNNGLSVFDLSNNQAYSTWRGQKLKDYPKSSSDLLVHIKGIDELSNEERISVGSNLSKTNMCLYQLGSPSHATKHSIRQFAAQFGYKQLDSNICADEDSISSLQTKDSGLHANYIPYTTRKISWHTDGYYNKPQNTIRGMLLHCANNAPSGGSNQYLDPEILYIYLRDKNPDWIRALMDKNALTIPANQEAGFERAAQTGPVFSLDNRTHSLHLRYTARTRSIQWDDKPLLKEALTEISQFLQSESGFIFSHKLQPGQGVLCNNVLHNRSAFEENDSPQSKRLIFRARYYDRAF